jgi:hypothetical protein
MMNGNNLADEFRTAEGYPPPTTAQSKVWGNAIISEIQNGQISNAPGTITGIAPPAPGPLLDGAGSNGMIGGLSGGNIASAVQAGFPFSSSSSKFTAFCNTLVSYIMSGGQVSFASGNITGVCTNTPLTPGVLTAGAGSGGTVGGMSASALASMIQSSIGAPSSTPQMTGFAQALIDHVQNNAVVTYGVGTVQAVCPAGGGSITAGSGSGGTIQ